MRRLFKILPFKKIKQYILSQAHKHDIRIKSFTLKDYLKENAAFPVRSITAVYE